MRAPRFVRLWMILVLAAVLVLVYWPSAVEIYARWSDAVSKTYTHGWLILAVCVWLVFRSRREIAAAPARPERTAQLLLAGCLVLWLVFYRASIESLEVALVPVIFWLAATGAFGWRVGRLLLFPVLFFYFAVPGWYGTPLKDLTVLVMRVALRVTGPPAVITGDLIHVPNGSFVIEEGCSGLHFMIVGLAVAALYGELQRDSWRTRLAQLALMAALALVANWVRVYTVIEAGYLTDMQSYLVRVSHYGFGWCVFAVALVIFLWLANRFGPEPGPEPDYAALESAAKPPTRLELIGFVGALVILLALPAASAGLRALHPSAALTAAAVVDPREPWSWATLDPHTAWAPRVGGADKQQHQAFFSTAGDTLEMYAAAIGVQRQGAELVGESTNLVGDRLDVRAEQVVGSAAGAFREAEVVDQTQAASLIWWRYEAAGQVFVVPLAEQLWYGIKATVSRPPARLIALRAPCTGGCDNARRVMSAFMTSGSVR